MTIISESVGEELKARAEPGFEGSAVIDDDKGSIETDEGAVVNAKTLLVQLQFRE